MHSLGDPFQFLQLYVQVQHKQIAYHNKTIVIKIHEWCKENVPKFFGFSFSWSLCMCIWVLCLCWDSIWAMLSAAKQRGVSHFGQTSIMNLKVANDMGTFFCRVFKICLLYCAELPFAATHCSLQLCHQHYYSLCSSSSWIFPSEMKTFCIHLCCMCSFYFFFF